MDSPDNAPVASQNPLTEGPRRGRNIWRLTVAPAALMLVGVAAVGAIAKLLPLVLNENADSVLRVVLAGAAVCMAVAMALRHRKQWVLPSDTMRRLIHEIRIGRAPIEDLAEFHPGCLRDLCTEVKLLLHEMRHQRQAVIDLKEEVRQRIANRTSVLERTIVSLRNQIVHDPLTGLYNRRMLDQLLPQLVSQSLAERKPLTLMMVDVDHFKELNDTLGHTAGDDMLRSVGQIIRSTIRDSDFGCRCGGDEFAIILPGCQVSVAKRIGERLESLVHLLVESYKVTRRPRLSIGISTLEEQPEPTAANLLRRADERLYESKGVHRTPVAPKAAPEAA
ncbi:MAG: GGDEF domain-containing protein [Tepidisphaeraceae bacterium]